MREYIVYNSDVEIDVKNLLLTVQRVLKSNGDVVAIAQDKSFEMFWVLLVGAHHSKIGGEQIQHKDISIELIEPNNLDPVFDKIKKKIIKELDPFHIYRTMQSVYKTLLSEVNHELLKWYSSSVEIDAYIKDERFYIHFQKYSLQR